MRHAQTVKAQVSNLRKKGLSLGEIHKKTNIPKTTIRLWIKDIILSQNQLKRLQQNTFTALQKGRIKAQTSKTSERKAHEEKLYKKAIEETSKLTKKDLFIAGLALYWGEGFKNIHEHRLGFCNSDPEMIVFYIKWLESTFQVEANRLIFRLTLNESYKEKQFVIQQYWLDKLNVSPKQFTKTFLQHSQWKKQYKTDSYHGVLRVHVKDSKDLLWRVRGWIEGMRHAKIGNTYLPG